MCWASMTSRPYLWFSVAAKPCAVSKFQSDRTLSEAPPVMYLHVHVPRRRHSPCQRPQKRNTVRAFRFFRLTVPLVSFAPACSGNVPYLLPVRESRGKLQAVPAITSSSTTEAGRSGVLCASSWVSAELSVPVESFSIDFEQPFKHRSNRASVLSRLPRPLTLTSACRQEQSLVASPAWKRNTLPTVSITIYISQTTIDCKYACAPAGMLCIARVRWFSEENA
jgi:hypothetical protein